MHSWILLPARRNLNPDRRHEKKDIMANMDPGKIWQHISDESLPSSLHSHPCRSLFMSRVLYPVPELGASLWNLFWSVEWANNRTASQFWDWTLRHLTDFLLPSSDFAIFATRSPSPVQLLLCNIGTRKSRHRREVDQPTHRFIVRNRAAEHSTTWLRPTEPQLTGVQWASPLF